MTGGMASKRGNRKFNENLTLTFWSLPTFRWKWFWMFVSVFVCAHCKRTTEWLYSRSQLQTVWRTLVMTYRKGQKDKIKQDGEEDWNSPSPSTTNDDDDWKKKKRIKGILALSRVIREGCKQLPLICPDRDKPRPLQLSAKSWKIHKTPKYIIMSTFIFRN